MKVAGRTNKYDGPIKVTKHKRPPLKLLGLNVEKRSRLNDKLRFSINPHTGKSRK